MKDSPEAVAAKLGSGQSLRGIGLIGRMGYAPENTNTITRDGSVALFAYGISDHRPNDGCGLEIYHNGISQPLKDDFKQLTAAPANVKNENGLEVSYDFAITPAMRLIPSYQHIWNPMAAGVAKNEHGADVFISSHEFDMVREDRSVKSRIYRAERIKCLKQSPTFSTIRTPSSYPASHKRYLQGDRGNLFVPHREIALSTTGHSDRNEENRGVRD